MKKYNKPTIKVMAVETKETLLDASVNHAKPVSGLDNAPDWGGDSDGTKAVGAKSSSLWDDEEE